jgi:hypothetical protein
LFGQPIDVTLLLNVISDFTIISTEGNGIRAEDESTVKLRASINVQSKQPRILFYGMTLW